MLIEHLYMIQGSIYIPSSYFGLSSCFFMLFLATMQPQMDLAKLKKDPCQIDSKLHHVFNATENHLTWLAHSE